MLASALDEVAAAATNSLPAAIASIAAKYAVTLVAPGQVRKFWDWRTEVARTAFPAVSISWADSDADLARPSAGIRDSWHRIKVSYAYRDTVSANVETHMKYIPEAIMLWLDGFPLAYRTPGKTITKIAPPMGRKVKLTHQVESQREDNASTTIDYVWDCVAEFEVEVRDQALGGAAVAVVQSAPSSINAAHGTTQPLVITTKDGSNNVLTGRAIAFATANPTIATVSATGLVSLLVAGSTTIGVFCEGILATVAVTVT